MRLVWLSRHADGAVSQTQTALIGGRLYDRVGVID
jgi:hypothetical protein